jgi:hypothetical protein
VAALVRPEPESAVVERLAVGRLAVQRLAVQQEQAQEQAQLALIDASCRRPVSQAWAWQLEAWRESALALPKRGKPTS